jgi:hypothetical protein
MNETDFIPELIAEIMAQGYDRKTAGKYAVLIGDTPVADQDGNILVMDGRRVVAKLKPLKMFVEM